MVLHANRTSFHHLEGAAQNVAWYRDSAPASSILQSTTLMVHFSPESISDVTVVSKGDTMEASPKAHQAQFAHHDFSPCLCYQVNRLLQGERDWGRSLGD